MLPVLLYNILALADVHPLPSSGLEEAKVNLAYFNDEKNVCLEEWSSGN